MEGERRGLLHGSIRTLFEAGTVTGLTDGQLLERFATRRGDASELAFAALVERHGPMVLCACRGVLGDDHEAMDAFQATFLVLARKGGSLWVRDSLGPWLHRVALRAAGRAKKNAARQRASEHKAAAMAESRNIAAADRDELAAIIHEEVDRLPERYRAAVVLCDLEGRTCEDAARHLGCPVGTIGSRLSRGRDRLRDRLTRRGLASGLLTWKPPREPLPSELVTATVAAAARFVSNQAASQGLAAILALGVLRSMTMTSWWKAASLLLAVTASTSGVVSLAGKGAGSEQKKPDDPPQAARADVGPVAEVKPGKLSLAVKQMGRLEATQTSNVHSKIEGQNTILSILPEGTYVREGQLVCELDSAALKDQLINQKIAVMKAEDDHRSADLAHDVAEIALTEYTEGVYPSERAAAQAVIDDAVSSIKRAEARLKRTQSARERLNATLSSQQAKSVADITAELGIDDRLDEAERAIAGEQRTLDVGRRTLGVLDKFTKHKTVKQLNIEIQTARAGLEAKRDARDLAKSKVVKLERQIADCKLLAPAAGMVVYANDSNSDVGRSPSRIEEGATVRERQLIFSIPDLKSPMRVVAKVHESVIAQIKPGQTARVIVHAFPNEAFAGVVGSVAPLSDSGMRSGPFYTTFVTIKDGVRGLRPGMSAQVDIVVEEHDDLLNVPVKAVIRYDDKAHVAVKTPDGKIDWREVTLGFSNGQSVEIKAGLKPGEAVVVYPEPLRLNEQKRKTSKPQAPAEPAQDKK